jgi:molybdenum cofactor cytidylyltransferase
MAAIAVVPAAGKGERFGGAKLLARIGGEALLDRTLASLIDAGLEHVIVVVAPTADFSPARHIADARVHVVVNPDPSRGMFSSIRAGVAVADGDPIVVLPADMPFVQASTVAAIVGACATNDGIVVPVHRGRRGHPVAFPVGLRLSILAAAPTSSLKAVLTATGAAWHDVEVEDPGVLRDVDTREDLAKSNEP